MQRHRPGRQIFVNDIRLMKLDQIKFVKGV
jgi:hypothetical protein